MAITKPIHETVDEPTWAIAYLFPYQGRWSEADYLALDTNHLVEFTDGYVEVLPMPTISHQRIVFFLQQLLSAFVTEYGLGEALAAPLRVRLRTGKYREPDVIFLSTERAAQTEKYPDGADLVMEVVSPDDPERDYIQKRAEYAEAGIPEYWIVDPQEQRITVLRLVDAEYAVHGEFTSGTQATSVLLDGFAADVADVFAAA